MASSTVVPSEPQKLVLYVLPDRTTPHKALSIRRTVKNKKGRYVTGDQVGLYGLFWPQFGGFFTRDELALQIGQQILYEAGV